MKYLPLSHNSDAMGFRFIFSLFIGLSISTLVNAQEVILVNDGESIQDAISNAEPGDTIRVAAGTYDECLFINKPINIIGAGIGESIISGGNNSSKAYLEERTILVYSPILLEGFTITQESENVDQNHNTMAILLETSGASTIRECLITNHITGIYISGSSANVIEDNTIDANGNGILFAGFIYDSDDNVIRRNVISNNGVANENDDAGIKIIPNYDGSGNVIVENDIFGNAIGINNQSSTVIVATGNWWGSGDGPKSDSNPDGNGNSIEGNVIHDDWTEEPNVILGVEKASVAERYGVSLFPNPTANGLTTLKVVGDFTGPIGVRIHSIDGAVKVERKVSSTNGLVELPINTQDMSVGVYFLTLQLEEELATLKMIVQ